MHVLNRVTGELLDLKILWQPPRARRRTKPVKRYTSNRSVQSNYTVIVTLLAVLMTAIVIMEGVK